MAYSPSDAVSPVALLQDLLTISLTAVNLLRPLYDPAGELIDFAPEYFNPAAQRMTGLLTERPTGTARTLFPDIFTNGLFAFYRRVFESGEAGHFALNYQADQLDNYFRVAAQRSGELLLVSFTDMADQDRSAVEVALRASQAAEQAARAEAEVQRQLFYDLLMQLPAQVAVHEGPDQVFTLVNPGYQRLAPGRELLGQPIREAWPELVSQGILDVLDHVYQTGEPFIGKELPFQVDFTRTGQVEQVYFNAFFLPLRDAQGQLRGVLDFSYDVTEQVLVRQRLQQFNAELEARVQERTQLAEQAQATAERERTLLQIILDQSPVAIGVFQGEELRITAANAQMAALWGRTPAQVLNQPFMEAVPELRGQGFDDIMRQVLRTEVPFIGTETPADVLRGEHVQTHYYNFVYQPLYDADGQLLGAIDVAVEVTEQVLARRQVEQLNQELEARVQERTEQLRAAQAAAERERALLQALLLQAPVAIALFQGEDMRVAAANAEMAAIWGYAPAQVVGRPLLEGVPELQGQGFDDLLRQVMATQVPVTGTEAPAQLLRGGQLHTSYYNFVYQPLYDAEGQVLGVIDVAVDVTEQVLARRQVEQLNQELEARVAARTHEAEAARADAERQRARLEGMFRQAPAAIAVYSGPDFVFELVNPVYQALLPGRPLLGKSVRDAFPEAAELPVFDTLRQVYDTGVTHHEQDQLIPVPGPDGTLENRYFNFTLQARYDEQHRVDGVVGFGFETTAQVAARRQAEALQAQLLVAAQQQAAERLAFFHIFEQAPVLVAMLRAPGHRFEYVNPAYQALFPGRQLLGRDVAEAVPEMQDQGFTARMDHVYQTGETYTGRELPFTAQPAPGQPPRPAYYNFTYQAYRENGEIAGISIFAFDVTEQVLARQEREAQRQELEQLFRQAPTPIVILDGPDLVFQLVNPAYQRIFPGRALAGKPLLEALPELVGTPIPDLFQRVYQTGEPVTVHELPLQMARHEGHALEEIYWTFTYQARRAAAGWIDGVRVFAQDVTESVRSRQASEANAQRLRLLTDALPVLIGYVDRERRYQFANEAYRTWFNRDPAELLGRQVLEIVGEKAYAAAAGYMDRALAGERFDFDATTPYREGFTRHIHTSYIPDMQQGAVRGFYTLVTDVTGQVEARQQVEALNQELAAINEELTATNEELNESNTQLTRTNVDLDTFVYTASHDLKAPISNIESIVIALRETLPPEVQQAELVAHLLGLLDNTVARFQFTIAQLTDISKLQLAHAGPAEPVPLAQVVEGVRLDLAPALQAAGTHLTIDVAPEVVVSFSPANLRSVVYNLLSNAVKYRAPDRPSQVQVRAAQTPHGVVLAVQDNGLGMSAVQQRQLFGLFQRLHTHVEGTGVGLYISKRLLENAGGTIVVQSQPNRGTTFTITFPA